MALPKIKPLGNRVLVKRSKATTSKGGILLPDSAQEKPKQGVVLSVGAGKFREDGSLDPVDVKEGDIVLFTSYAGTEVKSHGEENEEYLILSQDDILGVLAGAAR